jgi:hypothetical protein
MQGGNVVYEPEIADSNKRRTGPNLMSFRNPKEMSLPPSGLRNLFTSDPWAPGMDVARSSHWKRWFLSPQLKIKTLQIHIVSKPPPGTSRVMDRGLVWTAM